VRVHEDLHAHRLRDDEDITKDDRGVDEAKVAPYRLERDLARKRGRPADLEKLVLSPDGAELREVTSCLAHHPDRRTLGFFASCGPENEIIL